MKKWRAWYSEDINVETVDQYIIVEAETLFDAMFAAYGAKPYIWEIEEINDPA